MIPFRAPTCLQILIGVIPALLCAVSQSFAAETQPLISEIMFNPDGDENAREFVELYNPSGEPVDLAGWRIGDNDALDAIVTAGNGPAAIPPASYALVLDPDYFDADEPYDIPDDTVLLTVDDSAIGSRGLSNSVSETVYLVSAEGDTVAAATYDISCPAGHSWEIVRLDGGYDAANFASSLEIGGTPGGTNSVAPPPVNPALDSASIAIETASPVAGGNLTGAVTCINAGSDPLEGAEVTVIIEPDIFVGTCRFGGVIVPGGRSEPCGFTYDILPGGALELTAAISASPQSQPAGDDTVRVILPVAVPPGNVILNEVMAAPTDGPEWIELRNTGEWPVDLSGWKIADGGGSVSAGAERHCFMAPDGFALLAAENMAVPPPGIPVIVLDRFPALNNDGDTIVLHDHAGAAADSMAFDEARRGISIERIAPVMPGNGSAWDYSTAAGGATPGYANSIAWHRDEGAGSAELTIEPNPFLDTAEISYRLPFPVARVTLTVYDRRGRLVTRLRDAEESGASWSGKWDCNGGGKLPAGPYILTLEALNKRTGRMVHVRELVVIAAEL